MVVTDRCITPLRHLTFAALALPGVLATASENDFSIDTLFSRYAESHNRMKVDVYQATAELPLTDQLKFTVNGVKDIVTGASPVAYMPIHGKPAMILSGASISDQRDAVDIKGSYQATIMRFDLDVGRSSENDYNSSFFNIDTAFDFNEKNSTLALGYGFASDNVWAIDHCPPHCDADNASNAKYRRSDVGGDKNNHQGLLGFTQVLNKYSLLQTNLTYNYSSGYLSDPYKAVYTPWVTEPYPNYADSGYSHDTRPDSKHQFAILGRYIMNFHNLNAAALHLDYRFYTDTWHINAHTFSISWHQPIVNDWSIVPDFRYYSQNSADFYQPVFYVPRFDGYYSSDYRLARFGSFSGGIHIQKNIVNRLKLNFAIDFYHRDYDSALNGGAGSVIDNYTFSVFSAGVQYKF